MSQENMEIMRRAFEVLNARDPSLVKEVAAPDMEWRPVLTAGGDLERPVYRGPEGFVQYWTDLDELFEDTKVEAEELRPVGPDRVLFGGKVTARGRRSGAPVDERIWALWELRDRKLVRGTAYRTRTEALEAAGLSE